MTDEDVIGAVVHYGRVKGTLASVDTLHEALGVSEERPVLVVNNGPQSNTELESELTPGVMILGMGQNIGYGAAANLAFTQARATAWSYVMLLTNDATIDPSSVRMLRAVARSYGAAITAPTVLYQDGVTIWARGMRFSQRDGISRNVAKGENIGSASTDVEVVRYVTGCALLVEVGGSSDRLNFDPDFFLYYEDVDLCDTATELGKKICLVPRATSIHHKERQQGYRFPPTQQFHMARSGLVYYKKRVRGVNRATYLAGFLTLTVYRLSRSDSMASVLAGIRGAISGLRA